jgi:hypothetical protein
MPLAALRPWLVGVLLAGVAGISASPGAASMLWIGDFHGAGRPIRAAGVVIGFGAGVLAWRALGRSWPALPAVVVSIATASALAAVPVGLDQTSHLFRLYDGMTSADAMRRAAPVVPSFRAHEDVFDALRQMIPARDSYVLYADFPFVIWAHYWLLPRLAVDSPAHAQWAIFHDSDWKKYRARLIDPSRVGADTWIARVRR